MQEKIKSVTKKLIYKNKWLDFFEDKIDLNDGKQWMYSYAQTYDTIAVLPIDTEGNVYLIKQYRYLRGQVDTEAVAGGIEKDENPSVAAKRELIEELGIKSRKMTALGVYHPLANFIKLNCHFFIAEELEFGKNNLESTEDITMIKVPLEEAYRMAMSGEISHLPSALLILKAYNLVASSTQ
jgi:ADP-ribose pyrophosphatase